MMAPSTKYTRSTGHFWPMSPVHIPTIGLGLLLLFTSPASLSGQGDWDIGFTAGMANYMGDIGDGKVSAREFVWDLQELQTRPAFGAFARKKIDQDGLWHVRVDLSRIHIAGHDKDTEYAPRRGRNLHFRNHMTEVSIRMERDLFQKPLVWARQRRAMMTIRGFVGIARLEHNPQAQLDQNNRFYDQFSSQTGFNPDQWYDLAPLQTENEAYETTLTTIPFGLSAVVAGQKKGGATDFYLSMELGIRYTGNDYLDDISSFYADPAQMEGIGAALSSQSNQEVLDAAGPEAGSLTAHSYIGEDIDVIRGNPVNKDWYGTLVVSFGKVLNGRSNSFNRSRSRYGNKRGGGLFKKRTRMRF